MKKILLDSYRGLYLFVVSILWVGVISFALVQNGFLSELLIRVLASNSGVEIENVRGGMLGVLTLEDVRYKDIVSAKNINIKIDIFELANKRALVELLDIGGLKIDREKLQKELNTTKRSSEPLFDVVFVETLRISLLEHDLVDVVIKSAVLDIQNLVYTNGRLGLDYSAKVKTNIVDMNCEGIVQDSNYTASGKFQASGYDYVNKLSGDVDFEFNALKETPFVLKGDDKQFWVGATMKDSGVFYKYDVNARIEKVKSEMTYDLTNDSFKVVSIGEISTRYGVVESNFEVNYDKKTTYKGSGFIKKFGYIPLGVFAGHIRVLDAKNKKITFDGDINKVIVKVDDLTGRADVKGEAVDILNAKGVVDYEFKKSQFRVDVAGSGRSRFGDFDLNTTVFEDSKKFDTFSGHFSWKHGSGVLFGSKFINALHGKFWGDGNFFRVSASSMDNHISVKSDDYRVYSYSFDAKNTDLQTLFGLSGVHNDEINRARLSGKYDYRGDLLDFELSINDAKLFGFPLKISKISVNHSPNKIFVKNGTFELGSFAGSFGSNSDKPNSLYISSNGLQINSHGPVYEHMDFDASLDFNRASGWLREFFDIKQHQLRGSVKLAGTVDGIWDEPKAHLEMESSDLFAYDIEMSDLHAVTNYHKNSITMDKLDFVNNRQKYHLTQKPTLSIGEDSYELSKFSLNDKIFGSLKKKKDLLHAEFELKNFTYMNPKIAKYTLNGSGWLYKKDGKNYVNGEMKVGNVEVYLAPKGVRVTKDKDIKIIRQKAPQKIEEEYLKNTQINIRLIHEGKARYKTKDIDASLVGDLIYFKGFGQKANFIGLVKVLGGSYDFDGRRFILSGGELVLLNGENENPYIDMNLRLEERDITIMVGAKGFASAPKLTFSSIPALGEREIMSYLVFGIDDEFGFGKSQVKSDYTSKAIGAISNNLSRDVTREIGIKLDKVEISPSEYQQKDGKTVGTTKVEVGKKITKDLTVIYKNDVESGVALQYRLNKNIGIETENRARGSSIDIFFKQDY